MDILRGMLKSKTINVNVLLTGLLLWWLNTKGIAMDPAEAAGIVSLAYALLNIALRFFTNKSLPEKGIVIQNPAAVRQTVAAIEAHPEALDLLINAMRARIADRRAYAQRRPPEISNG